MNVVPDGTLVSPTQRAKTEAKIDAEFRTGCACCKTADTYLIT
jgi:hypothetical protein